METVAKEEFFYSEDFLIQMKFNEDGSVDGWVVHYPIGCNLAQKFSGISIEENGLRKFSFFIEWTNPNLNDKVLTAYSGEISPSEHEGNRLILEWLQVSGNPLSICPWCYKGRELLSDVAQNASASDVRRAAFYEMLGEAHKGL